ncbi:hypothetical protein [Nocardioides dongxiaopingii]|uniref:hypothetical protein n=1 Tax=Nocardioides TaxID=1839 RepID=UPI00148581F7|nr:MULTISPECIES: hypothetical protein [Nocardioides]
MTYEVVREQDLAGKSLTQTLNEREADGWTLVHVKQGHLKALANYSEPEYVFHKP